MSDDSHHRDDPWLTLAEIASELRVNPATVRQWVSKGTLQATRGGLRKWVVRRSDLDRMLAAANEAPSDATPSPSPRGRAQHGGDPPPKAAGSAKPAPSAKVRHAAKLAHLADQDLSAAMDASRYAAPAPGYLNRIRDVAEGFEHLASALRNAQAAGLKWSNPRGLDWDFFSYELRPGGNRPGDKDLWAEFDNAVERLGITMTGTDTTAIATANSEVRDRLLEVADALEADSPHSQIESA